MVDVFVSDMRLLVWVAALLALPLTIGLYVYLRVVCRMGLIKRSEDWVLTARFVVSSSAFTALSMSVLTNFVGFLGSLLLGFHRKWSEWALSFGLTWAIWFICILTGLTIAGALFGKVICSASEERE